MGSVQACLNEIFALGLGDKRLQLCGGESVDETGLGHNEQQHLRAREGRELVRLCEQKSKDTWSGYDAAKTCKVGERDGPSS